MNSPLSGLKYRAFLTIFTSMFLTLAVPVLSPAQSACHFVHKPLVSSTSGKLEKLLTKSYSVESARTFQTALADVKSVRELQDFLSEVLTADGKIKDRQWSGHLQRMTLLPTLQKSFESSNPKEITDLVRFLKNSAKGRNPEGFSNGVGGWMYPLLMHLEPARAVEFAKNIKVFHDNRQSLNTLYAGLEGPSVINYTLIQVLGKLPVSAKHEITAALNKELLEINLESEVLKMKNGLVTAPVIRRHRRNIEMMTHLALYGEVANLKSSLAQARSLNEITKVMDQYYAQLGQVVSPVRGDYSFIKVAESAKIIQNQFKDFLNNKTDYVEVYGSFANGKATFKTSDVDMKISESLFAKVTGKTYEQVEGPLLSLYFADFIKRDAAKSPAALLKFWEKYKQAETEIGAKVFERAPLQESEMLSTLYPPQPFRNNPSDSRWYNPVTVRIYSDRIEVRVNDLINSTEAIAQF